MEHRTRRMLRTIASGTLCAAALLLATSASASDDSCREWKREHGHWMTEAVRLYLDAAPQPELDTAVFEILQREAYLTSCDISLQKARSEQVGWRLVGRTPDEYGSAVLETVLACAGFELDLRTHFEGGTAQAASTPPRPQRRYGPRAR